VEGCKSDEASKRPLQLVVCLSRGIDILWRVFAFVSLESGEGSDWPILICSLLRKRVLCSPGPVSSKTLGGTWPWNGRPRSTKKSIWIAK